MPSAKTFLKTAAMALIAVAIANRVPAISNIVYKKG